MLNDDEGLTNNKYQSCECLPTTPVVEKEAALTLMSNSQTGTIELFSG